MPRTARCTTARHAVAAGAKNPLVDPQAGAPVASGAMISTTRTPGALTVGPLRPVILKLAAPAVAMMACHFCFNLIDAIWVGRLIGPAALAAVSTAGFYGWVLLSLGEMVEVGLIAVAARRHGEGLRDAAARAAGAAVVYALAAGTVASLVGLALTDGLFHLMSVTHDVATLARDYLDTWLLGGPLVFGFFAIEATFRASGDTRTPFLLLMASVVLSVGLDPLLISGIGPFPRLGVQGAALTSVMVRGGGFLIGIGIAWRRRLIRLDVPDWRAVPSLLRVGAPLSLAGVLLSVVYMWLTRYTSGFGTAALAALGIGHKMEGLGFIAISGFALSASALVGQNLGARQEARARQAVRITVGYCLAVTTTTAVAFLTIPGTLVALFTSDAAVIADGSLYLRVIAVAQIGQTFEVILEGALAGAGYTLWPQLARTPLTLLRVPLPASGSRANGPLGHWLAPSGTAARVLAASTAGHFFVAPDNGLLSFLPADAHFVGLPVPEDAAPTFQARDVFAPVAGQLALGAPLSQVGHPVTDVCRSPLPAPHHDGTVLVGEGVYVDRFGTLISNIPRDEGEPGVRIKVGGTEIGTLSHTFGDVGRGALVAFVGSGGTVEIAVRDGSAARLLGVGVGAEVRA